MRMKKKSHPRSTKHPSSKEVSSHTATQDGAWAGRLPHEYYTEK